MPTVQLDSTLEMYYEDDDYTDPWRTPETVVLHHGNAKSSRLWYAWVPLLARQYRVIRLDARGFGRSSVPPEGYDWSLSNFATDLQALLDHLGIDKAHLIGETVGGTISLKFAHEHPERLHSLTVCTSPYKFAGVSTYQEYYKLVQEEGVAGWGPRHRGPPSRPQQRPGASTVVRGADVQHFPAGRPGNPGVSRHPGPDRRSASNPGANTDHGGGRQRGQQPRPQPREWPTCCPTPGCWRYRGRVVTCSTPRRRNASRPGKNSSAACRSPRLEQ